MCVVIVGKRVKRPLFPHDPSNGGVVGGWICRPFFAGSRDAETKESRHAVAVAEGRMNEHVPPQRGLFAAHSSDTFFRRCSTIKSKRAIMINIT